MASRPITAWTPPTLRAPAPAPLPVVGDDEPTLTAWSPFADPTSSSVHDFRPVTGPPPPPRPPPTLPPVPDDADAPSSVDWAVLPLRRPVPAAERQGQPAAGPAAAGRRAESDSGEVDSDEVEGGDRTGTFQRPIRGAVSRVSPARMIVEIGPNLGTVYGLPAQGGEIGRGAGCAVQLRSAQVSRRHAVLIRVDADVFVEDVSHRNGLFLNQVRVHRTRLLDGDLLQVGDVVLRFERG